MTGEARRLRPPPAGQWQRNIIKFSVIVNIFP
jgi:hypothetical protein